MSVYESKQRLARVRKRRRAAAADAVTDPAQKSVAQQLAKEEAELKRRIAREEHEATRAADALQQKESSRLTAMLREARDVASEMDAALETLATNADRLRALDLAARRVVVPYLSRDLLPLQPLLTEHEFDQALQTIERHFEGRERAVPSLIERVNWQTSLLARLVSHTLTIDLEEK